MDIYSDAAVFGGKVTAGFQPEMVPSAVSSSIPGEFLPVDNAEGGDDASLEWLSMFMEDCLSATPNYMTSSQPHPPPPATTTITTTTTTTVSTAAAAITATTPNPPPQLTIQPFLHDPTVLSKARTKRRKFPPRTHHQAFRVIHSDPPLLQQTHWLADSELIFPKMEHQVKKPLPPPPPPPPPPPLPAALAGGGDEKMGKEGSQGGQQPRRCTHCLSHKTPQWRAGPQGPKTLCNACGVRFKSGRLHPEYRPAKSPTFVSYKHSNSHKKVMEMRMALLPSHSK